MKIIKMKKLGKKSRKIKIKKIEINEIKYTKIHFYDFQNEICTKKYCELIKAVAEIFSLEKCY